MWPTDPIARRLNASGYEAFNKKDGQHQLRKLPKRWRIQRGLSGACISDFVGAQLPLSVRDKAVA